MFRYAALAALSMLLAVSASAQRAPTFQSGQTNPGDIAKMQSNNAVTGGGDVLGDKNGRGVNPFAILDRGGLGLCTRTDATSKEHNAFCIGHDSDGNPVLTVDSYGGMAAKILKCRINGVETDCPGNVDGGGIPVTLLGVIAGGNIDNTAAMQAIIDSGKYHHIYFPASDQPYKMQNVIISSKIFIEGKPGSTVMFHHAVSAGITPIFRLNDGSEGSVLEGFVCDGNRDALGSQFIVGNQWPCLQVNNTAITAHLRLQNFVARSVMLGNCDPGLDLKLVVEDSGTVINSYNCVDGKIDIVARRIGNDGIAQFAHPATMFGDKRMHVRYVLDDWNPDTANLDPIPVGFASHYGGEGNDYDIRVSGFHGTDTNGEPACRGIVINGGTRSDYKLWSSGCVQNIRVNGATDSHIKCYGDGQYIVAAGYENMPFRIGYGAWASPNVANSTWDTNGMSPSARLQVECTGIRGKFNYISGVQDSFIKAVGEGNTQYGLKVGCEITSTPFNGQPGQCPSGVTIEANAQYNGDAGISFAGFQNVTLSPASILANNGQGSTDAVGGVWGSGAIINKTDENFPTTKLNVPGVLLAGDNQLFTSVDGASFEPGTTDENNQYTITLVNPQHAVGIGQHITLTNAGGAGIDITGKIVAVADTFSETQHASLVSNGGSPDTITLETAAPTTFVDTGNTTPLTGTATTNGLLGITMTGGAAVTELPGHTLITDGSEWRRVERVNSDTSITINVPFTATLAGATLSKLTVDIVGIPSQKYGVALVSTGLTGNFRFGGINADGALNSTFYANGQADLLDFDNAFILRGMSGTSVLGSGATLYVGPGLGSTNLNQTGQLIGKDVLLRKLTCKARVPPTADSTCVIGQGGSDTSAACTIPAGQGACATTAVNPPLLSDYSAYAKFVGGAGIANTTVEWAAELVPGFSH